jgi:hypothetical protein
VEVGPDLIGGRLERAISGGVPRALSQSPQPIDGDEHDRERFLGAAGALDLALERREPDPTSERPGELVRVGPHAFGRGVLALGLGVPAIGCCALPVLGRIRPLSRRAGTRVDGLTPVPKSSRADLLPGRGALLRVAQLLATLEPAVVRLGEAIALLRGEVALGGDRVALVGRGLALGRTVLAPKGRLGAGPGAALTRSLRRAMDLAPLLPRRLVTLPREHVVADRVRVIRGALVAIRRALVSLGVPLILIGPGLVLVGGGLVSRR